MSQTFKIKRVLKLLIMVLVSIAVSVIGMALIAP